MSGPRARLALAAALCLVSLLGSDATAHREILGWWKYDPVFWRHDFREHDDLRQIHRHWHDAHRRPKRTGLRLKRWRGRHARIHHLRLDHPHQAIHFPEALARQAGQASWYDVEGATGSCGQPLSEPIEDLDTAWTASSIPSRSDDEAVEGMAKALDKLCDRYPYLVDVSDDEDEPPRDASRPGNTGRTPRPPRSSRATSESTLAQRFPALRGRRRGRGRAS